MLLPTTIYAVLDGMKYFSYMSGVITFILPSMVSIGVLSIGFIGELVFNFLVPAVFIIPFIVWKYKDLEVQNVSDSAARDSRFNDEFWQAVGYLVALVYALLMVTPMVSLYFYPAALAGIFMLAYCIAGWSCDYTIGEEARDRLHKKNWSDLLLDVVERIGLMSGVLYLVIPILVSYGLFFTTFSAKIALLFGLPLLLVLPHVYTESCYLLKREPYQEQQASSDDFFEVWCRAGLAFFGLGCALSTTAVAFQTPSFILFVLLFSIVAGLVHAAVDDPGKIISLGSSFS